MSVRERRPHYNPFHKLRRFTTYERELRGPQAHEIVETPFHTFACEQICRLFKVDAEKGLGQEQVTLRLEEHGPNELIGSDGVSPWAVFFRQLFNALTLVLIVATVIALAVKDWLEAGVIIFVIIFNTFVGFLQEYRAEKTMESLRRTASPSARVLRDDGHVYTIAAKDLVPGDVILVEQGDSVAGDARLIETFNLEIDEAMLTGESLPVEKKTDRLTNRNQALGDRNNMIYLGTNVVKGRGKGVIVTTGMKTQMGRIAKSLLTAKETSTSTPLQKRLNKLALALFGFAIILAIIVFAVYNFRFTKSASIYAISVAIAMIPEGLVAVVTLTMALGVRRMASQKAIVRKLAALEALGSTTDICSDKTGTLTQGKMVLTKIYVPGEDFYGVTGTGLNPKGEVINNSTELQVNQENMSSGLSRLVECAALCNASTIRKKEVDGNEIWNGAGDPTEVALQVLAYKLGSGKPQITRSTKNPDAPWTVVQEFPFDSSIKRMSVVCSHEPTGDNFVFAKGGLENLLPLCIKSWDGMTKQEVDIDVQHYMELLQEKVSEMASNGLRVLSLAYRRLPEKFPPRTVERELAEGDLVFVGLVGINDPPRPETAAAVVRCHQAGITVRMLTGDHPKTAAAIAEQVGILDRTLHEKSTMATAIHMDATGTGGGKGKEVWTGTEFDALSDEEIDKLAELPLVVARCTPETKVKMIDALERRNKIAAMTGDGVNDSPSLKKAPIGIAMGMSGSDVAKQASSIVLTDDNFATIVSAVAQGRRIFANIQKFVLHLMSTNVAEVVALIIGLCFVDNSGESVYPLSPLQILFLNMVTSSPPAMALGIEPPHEYQMRSPLYRGGPLFNWNMIIDIFFYGFAMGGIVLTTFVLRLYGFGSGNLADDCNLYDQNTPDLIVPCNDVYRARATAYVALTWLLLVHAYVCRHRTNSIFRGGVKYMIKSNKALAYCCLFGMVIIIPTLYIPGTSQVFRHEGISWEWGIVGVGFVLYILVSELYKWVWRVVMRFTGTSQEEVLKRYETFRQPSRD